MGTHMLKIWNNGKSVGISVRSSQITVGIVIYIKMIYTSNNWRSHKVLSLSNPRDDFLLMFLLTQTKKQHNSAITLTNSKIRPSWWFVYSNITVMRWRVLQLVDSWSGSCCAHQKRWQRKSPHILEALVFVKQEIFVLSPIQECLEKLCT